MSCKRCVRSVPSTLPPTLSLILSLILPFTQLYILLLTQPSFMTPSMPMSLARHIISRNSSCSAAHVLHKTVTQRGMTYALSEEDEVCALQQLKEATSSFSYTIQLDLRPIICVCVCVGCSPAI